jgi:hypothetical protein
MRFRFLIEFIFSMGITLIFQLFMIAFVRDIYKASEDIVDLQLMIEKR